MMRFNTINKIEDLERELDDLKTLLNRLSVFDDYELKFLEKEIEYSEELTSYEIRSRLNTYIRKLKMEQKLVGKERDCCESKETDQTDDIEV